MSKIPLFAIAILAASAASAQEPQANTRAEVQKQIDQNFDKADTNNDGFLSREEIQGLEARSVAQAQEKVDAQVAAQFQKLDTDKSGSLSLAELKAGTKIKSNQPPEALVARFDANKDGKVSAAEFKGPMLAAFDKADANKDGKVTPEEAKKAQGGGR